MSIFFVTPWPLAHQTPSSMGFSRQEHWSRLPCPQVATFPTGCCRCLVAKLCLTLLGPQWTVAAPHSSVHGIFQARILEQFSISLWGLPCPQVAIFPTGCCRCLVAKSCLTLLWPQWTVAAPHYSVHGIFQARILEQFSISFSMGLFLT